MTGPVPGNGEQARVLVQRLADEVVNARSSDTLEEIATGELAGLARRWIDPFRLAFPDFRMTVVDVIAQGDRVAAHFKCSGTHTNPWLGFAPTQRRFEDVTEIYFFRIRDGRLAQVDAAVEDNLDRMRQLGLIAPPG